MLKLFFNTKKIFQNTTHNPFLFCTLHQCQISLCSDRTHCHSNVKTSISKAVVQFGIKALAIYRWAPGLENSGWQHWSEWWLERKRSESKRRRRKRRKSKSKKERHYLWWDSGHCGQPYGQPWFAMQEAGQRVQPNISRFSVASILWTFRRGNR